MRLLGVIWNLFIYLFFLQEDFTRTKSIKRIQAKKNKEDSIFMYIKTSKSTSTFTILLTCTSLNLPYDKLFVRVYFYLWSPMKISLLYDHPWKSFLFIITHGNLSFLWLPMEIFPFYDHLWKSFLFIIIHENLSSLWSSMKISLRYDHPWKSFL